MARVRPAMPPPHMAIVEGFVPLGVGAVMVDGSC